MTDKPTIFAIDFGTSNSLLAAASRDRVFEPIALDDAAKDPTLLRTALYFAPGSRAEFGVRAITALVDNGFRGRLIRSIKRHLPSRTFTATQIGSRKATLEDLIGAFLRAMRERANQHFDVDVRRVVLGRPARFSNEPADDQLAEDRLRAAAVCAGFEEITFCPEPVAAAYDFAEGLTDPRTIVVADLGGGTSDFTVARAGQGGFTRDDVRAVGGVAVAGDALDGSLVRALVAPHFGGRARYKAPFGANELDMPKALIELLASPADLTVVDRDKVLRLLDNIRLGLVDASDRDKVERFVALVEDGLGFTLYEGVEAAKVRLSEEDSTVITVPEPSLDVRAPATRAELEACSAKQIDAIVRSLDKTLETATVPADEVDIVCFTGGTSRVPAVARAISERLPRAEVRRMRSFHSVAVGLARRARELAAA
ncbi:MAG: Hsp70 family protein [Polyangiaceae bacterium]|nr:Hsp70 family protein [Polyangiaceae bacterium]